MFNSTLPQTIDEIRADLDELVSEASDPNSELNRDMAAARLYVREVEKFDAVLAQKFGAIILSFEDLVSYVKARKERS